MNLPVSLWILVARTDVSYMRQTIPHLLRTCRHPFAERVLAMDTAPLSGFMPGRYQVGTQQELEAACQTLVDQGFIDRIVKIDYDSTQIQNVYQKYFGAEQARQMLNYTHNWKGSTVYASLYCIEASATDYYLHFDADMLLHQKADFDWVNPAVRLMESNPKIVTIRPFCGPPLPEGLPLHLAGASQEEGFYGHKTFSMRTYLVDKHRFAQLAPIPLMWKYYPMLSRYFPPPFQSLFAKVERQLRPQIEPIQGAIESFEVMMNHRLKSTNFIRADLSSTDAWTLHPPKHNYDYLKALPNLIEFIEKGEYPPGQAGNYDVLLNEWSELLNAEEAINC